MFNGLVTGLLITGMMVAITFPAGAQTSYESQKLQPPSLKPTLPDLQKAPTVTIPETRSVVAAPRAGDDVPPVQISIPEDTRLPGRDY